MKYISSKVIVYVHEGKRTLELFNHQGFVTYNLNAGDKIITVSEAVKKVLEKDFKVKQNIEIVPGGVDLNYLSKDSANSYLKKEGIPSGSFIIMSCGWLDWHKGTDFFIQIAKILLVQNEKMHFVWIGGNLNDQEFKHMKFDIEKLNLSNRISIITSNSNAIDYIFSADIFLMLSREESFSLVTLEAGLAQKPVLCFQDSGGPTEIVNFDPRFIVPYADIIGMSKRIKDLSENENERQEMGKYLYNRIRDNYSIEKSASSLLNIINRELTNAY
jgi:glycosyltransferase involved in cell wall biosynthesis